MSKNIVLQGVSLRCFKRHGELDVSFSPSVTAIRGPNYAGKSSVLQALFFAMFGVTAVPGGKAAILKDGAKEVTVKFFFTVDGEEAEVIRTLGAASVYVKGELVASGNTVVSKWFEDLFGMEQKTVMMLAYSSQGETSAMVTLGATALNRIIETVADTDYIDTLMEKAGKIATRADAELSVLGAYVDTAPLLEQVEGLEEAVSVYEQRVKVSVAQQDASKAELELSRRVLDAAITNNTKAQKYKSDLDTFVSLLEYKQRSLLEHQEKFKDKLGDRDYQSELGKVDEELKELREHRTLYMSYRNQRDAATNSLKKVSEWIEGPGKQGEMAWNEFYPQYLEAAAAAKQEQAIYDNLNQSLAIIAGEYRRAEADLKNSVCITCKRALDAEHLEHAQAAFEQLKAKKDEQTKTVERQRVTLVGHQDKEAVLKTKLPAATWKEWLDKAIKEQAEHQNTLDNLVRIAEPDEGLLSTTEQRYGSLQMEYQSAVMARSTEVSLKKGIEEAKVKVGEMLLNPLEVTDLDPLRATVEVQNTKHNELMLEVGNLTVEYRNCQSQVKTAKDKLALESEQNSRRKTAEVRAVRFKALQTWLRNNKAAFMENIWNGLLGVCSDFVAQVTSNRVTQIERDPDGTFYFTENGSRLPMVCASGGQKSIVGVGIRIALATLLPQACRFVALDEPSAELNDEHAAALAGALRGQDRQVILVTHREGDEFASDAVVLLN